MAQEIHPLREADPSEKFVNVLEQKLLARHREMQADSGIIRKGSDPRPVKFNEIWQNLVGTLAGARKTVVNVALIFVLVVAAGFAAFNFLLQSPASASTCVLSIMSGSVDVKEPEADDWVPGYDSMILTAGARAVTGDDSHALITFAEGNTVTLQPGTDIEIASLEVKNNRPASVVLKQSVGVTWSNIVNNPEQSFYYKIETPSASALALGTLFTTEVGENGNTRVISTRGTIRISAQGEEVDLPANNQIEVQTGEKPTPPTPVPVPESYISISVGSPAVASVIDPTGTSTGRLPDGTSFNQIPEVTLERLDDGTQVFGIPGPLNGEYTVALRYIEDGEAGINVRGVTGDTNIFEESATYTGEEGQGWLIRINIVVEDGKLKDGEIISVDPLTSEMPEKVVKVSHKEKEVEDKQNGQSNDDQQDKDNNGQGNDDEQDKDNNGQGNDDKQDKDNNGQGNDDNQDKDNNGQGNSDNQDKDNNSQGNSDNQDKDNNGQGNDEQDKDNNGQGNDDKQDKDNNGQGNDDKQDKDNNGQGNNDKQDKIKDKDKDEDD